MGDRLLHFVHTSLFEEDVEEVLGDDGLRALQKMIQANPEVGRLIQGAGGARKIRVAVGGRGKRGGARVIHYFQSAEDTVYLLLAYAKSEAADLTQAGKNTLKSIIQEL